MLEDAINFAVDAHAGQFDKSGKLYIYHPYRVMHAVDGELDKTVAILHDTVEDCDVGLGDILALFGSDVWKAVDALTRRDCETYVEFIERCKVNPVARRVKIADIKDNLRPGAPEMVERYTKALQVLEHG
jgi:(p)ppGpp synthase/HD superfamily hydrolase